MHYFTGESRLAEEKRQMINNILDQELPCYEYQFPIKNHTGLSKNDLPYSVKYNLRIDNHKYIINITPPKSSKKEKSIILMYEIFVF